MSEQYNPIFSKLVDGAESDASSRVLGMIAYGLYKTAKKEWTEGIREKHGRGPNEQELDAYVSTWTPSQLENLRKRAAQVLAEYADEVISAEKPTILEEAIRGTYWPSVFRGMSASFFYTLLLLAVAFVIGLAGIDILSAYQRFSSRP